VADSIEATGMIKTRKKSRTELARRARWRKAKGILVTKADDKTAARLHKAAVIALVRAQVWIRSWAMTPLGRMECCDLCGKPMGGEDGEMHEEPSRADTAGKPPEERWNLSICCRAHKECHRKQTENIEWIYFQDPTLGFQGRYAVCQSIIATMKHVTPHKVLFRQEARLGVSRVDL
jgi:hypothetical protein